MENVTMTYEYFIDEVKTYISDLNELDMIKKAYEITVDSTNGASLAYANAILERWNSEGIRTPEQADAEKQEKQAAAKNGSFDTDSFFEAALQRSFSSDRKEESEE